jgi:hypothetical protein
MRSLKVHYQGEIYRFPLGMQHEDEGCEDNDEATYYEFLQREIYDKLVDINNDFSNEDKFRYVDEDGDRILVRSIEDMHENHLEIWNAYLTTVRIYL